MQFYMKRIVLFKINFKAYYISKKIKNLIVKTHQLNK